MRDCTLAIRKAPAELDAKELLGTTHHPLASTGYRDAMKTRWLCP